MRIGYLMNTYPVTSATFIRREIAALESRGVHVRRFAIRPWDQALVDAEDQQEQTRCSYLLAPGALALGLRALRETVLNPLGVARAARGAVAMWRNAGAGSLVRHLAYFLEAVHLKQVSGDLDHIHAHFSTNTAAVALLSARLGGAGYSFTAHGPDEFDDPRASSLGLKLQEARFAVAITQFARTRLALAGGMAAWEKLHVVRCGVPMPPAPEQLPGTDAPFVCVGRLCPQKAQTLLVDAMAQVVRTHPDARLVLVGDGETRPQVEAAIARHGLGDNVALLGWADNATVRQHLAGACAMVLPSFAEGLPIVIMEAFAQARPVVSTYIAGIPELVDGSCGWLIPAGDVTALAGAMQAVLNAGQKDLAGMGQIGRARVCAQHDLARNAQELHALFAKALALPSG